MDWRVDFLPCKAKIRRHPDGWQGFLTQSGRKIRRQDMRGEILNRLLPLSVRVSTYFLIWPTYDITSTALVTGYTIRIYEVSR